MDPAISHNPAAGRFEVHVDGRRAGVALYSERPGLRAFTHTEVDGAFRGQGLAAKLVEAALADSQREGFAVLPFCEYVSAYILRHREFVELVPPALRGYFEL